MNNSITTTLRTLTGDIERLLADRLRPLDLTVPQMQFLADFAANPGHSGADAARASHISAQTGTTILRNLTVKQYITVRHVPGAGRRNEITVTARGKNVLGQAQEAVGDVEKRLAALLGTEAAFRLGFAVSALDPHLSKRTH